MLFSNPFLGRNFNWASQWRTSDAPERRTKRLMEKENRAAQTKAKKAYTDQVTMLVVFVRKRDARVKAHLAAVAKEREEKQKAASQRLENQKMIRAAERKEWLAKEQERILEGERRMREAYGDLLSDEHASSEEEFLEYECAACSKVFKSHKQYANHENSKKHKANVEALRYELQLEESLLDLNLEEDAESKENASVEDVKYVHILTMAILIFFNR
jgi:DnaJ homolog subfamily A member 5